MVVKNIGEKAPSNLVVGREWKYSKRNNIHEDFSDHKWAIGKPQSNKAYTFNPQSARFNNQVEELARIHKNVPPADDIDYLLKKVSYPRDQVVDMSKSIGRKHTPKRMDKKKSNLIENIKY
jgi:hypothetical protein